MVWERCASAAILVDGRIVASTSEERFTRIKNDERFPENALQAVMEIAGIESRDIDLVALPGISWSPRYILSRRYSVDGMAKRLKEQKEYWYPRMYLGKDIDYYDLFDDELDISQEPRNWSKHIAADGNLEGSAHDKYFQEFRRRTISEFLGIAPDIVTFVDHHRSHAFYAYFASRIRSNDQTLVLTADAGGDNNNATVSIANPTGLRRLHGTNDFMVARLYRHLTLLLGMQPDEHEYKVMGLAPYGKREYYEPLLEVFRRTQYVDGLGFNYNFKPPDLYVYFREAFEGARFDNIAGALQSYCEEIVCEWVKSAIAKTGTGKVALAGGIGMNVKTMQKVSQLAEVEELYLPPTPSDESLAMGAAYATYFDYAQKAVSVDQLKPLEDAYLGCDVQGDDVRETLSDAKRDPTLRIMDRVSNDEIAERIVEGKILGRCVGRSEFGARALGNRSILADPRTMESVNRINSTVKSRDFWMPFAPTILKSWASKYLNNPKALEGPYMTLAFETTTSAQRDLIAVIHPADHTCRAQILDREANPTYYELIEAVAGKAGIGAVLNTSLNVHGEPIVQRPQEALKILLNTDLDMIQVGQSLIEKTGYDM